MKFFRLLILSNATSVLVTTIVVLFARWKGIKEGESFAGFASVGHRVMQQCCACSTQWKALTCPTNEGSTTFSTSGKVSLPISRSNRLCTLVQVSPDGDSFKPLARSYNEFQWEAYSGEFATQRFVCTGSLCATTLPDLPDGATYQLTSFDPPQLRRGNQDEIARFLEQATFGPTREGIASFQTSNLALSFAKWVQDQQTSVPMTSHRALYRIRLNSRMEVATRQGPVTHPCQKGTRYRRAPFSYKDNDKYLDITTVGGGKRILSVDGFVRTVVDGPVTGDWDQGVQFPDGSYRISWNRAADDKLGGSFSLYQHTLDTTVGAWFNGIFGQPEIKFDATSGANPNILINLSTSVAIPIDTRFFQDEDVKVQELILTKELSASVCATLSAPGNPLNPVFGLFNGDYYIHDSRYKILENTLEAPAPDGGGQFMRDTTNIVQPDLAAMCSNAPRTFLNKDSCYLSYDPVACTVGDYNQDEASWPAFYVDITPDTIRQIYDITGGGGEKTHYLYSINGLRIQTDKEASVPCQRYTTSRFIPVTCSGAAALLDETFRKIFGDIITWSTDNNEYTRDVWNGHDLDCPAPLFMNVGFEVEDINGNCWQNVHPDHLNVYDFTYWTQYHPGNSAVRNPIKEIGDAGNTELWFPDWHGMDRWSGNKYDFGYIGKLGDKVHYYRFPKQLRSQQLNDYFGFQASEVTFQPSEGVIVCGSPFEVANNPDLGGNVGSGAFSSLNWDFSGADEEELIKQKRLIWTDIALGADDQLRQRVAWALSQILVISPTAISDGEVLTEAVTVYYDIFVRHAFGKYRDILKEVSFSHVMAEMLTYYGSKSTAYIWRVENKVEYADENFAREIMQLFTTGLYKLNPDGTQVLDNNGDPVRVYTNDDIVEYARVWTGFEAQRVRGNIETASIWNNQVDPLKINMEYRDIYPKMGLDRTYIGDGIPLCADLPVKHFLKKGASYRLLGGSSLPELLNDPAEWKSETLTKRLTLSTNSKLFRKLCGSENQALCTFAASIALDESVVCTGQECSVDTVRVVEVTNGIFYEYHPPPCVFQAFFREARMVVRRWDWSGYSCADPRTQVASSACCEGDVWEWHDEYWGERTTAKTAETRCSTLCDVWPRPSCEDSVIGSYCYSNEQFWTSTTCNLRVKIDTAGNVAIVHAPTGYNDTDVTWYLREDAKTFFRVDWNDDPTTITSDCESNASCDETDDGMCVCDVYVVDETVFTSGTPSREQVLDMLHIGAFDPALSTSTFVKKSSNGVSWYTKNGILDADTIFEVIDQVGRRHFRKNMRSTVHISGRDISFRNPVHFISLVDPELYQAEYETDAALDHYVYHTNTAPFLAIRFAQRFGISNPSPGLVERIGSAFRTGVYTFVNGQSTIRFGSGEYGDLAATVACVLLDRETRTVLLDADPSHGSMREPLLKLVSTLRALDFQLENNKGFVDFNHDIDRKIGEMAHAIPNVFSFFLPEYKPSGPVALASMVAPEAQVITGPRIVDTLNGMLSLFKYGLSTCYGGFARDRWWEDSECWNIKVGSVPPYGLGRLSYTPPNGATTGNIVDELSTLLTGGRLSSASRQLIKEVISTEPDQTLAVIKAQQLIAMTPEFHSTNIVRKNGETRSELQAPARSTQPYKAVVYVLLEGGMDSFNMLAPHTCVPTNDAGQTLLDQYYSERTSIAINDDERSRIISASGQPCEEFVIHQDLEIVETLYNNGDLSFFANAGVLNQPVNKNNYYELTKTQLFAHNAMQEEAQKIDAFDGAPGTGILGRMCDILNQKGFHAQPITVEDATIATVGVPGAAVDPLFISPYGASKINPKPDGEDFDPTLYIGELNDAVKQQSSLFGETWSQRVQKALFDNKALVQALETTQLTTSFSDESDYAKKLKVVATLMVSHNQRGTDRDVFYVSLGGWDNHGNLKSDLARNFVELNGALSAFSNEMKAQGLWDSTALIITSDFARTLTSNSGEGSDHAWGGNYFIMGGNVKGGQIHGDYPADITTDGPYNIGRGRLIPSMSWESIFNSVVQWMGVETNEDVDYCLPNRKKTGTKLFTASEVFQ